MENVFELELDESLFEDMGLAFVEVPATHVHFMKFDSQEKYYARFSQDQDKQIVTGPVLIPDLPIKRRAQDGSHFYVVVREPEVIKSYNLFMQKERFTNINLMHDPDIKIDDQAYMLESFITDPERGINAPKGFEDLPDNTWFMSYKVMASELWDKVQGGDFNGFSIEQKMRIKNAHTNELQDLLSKLKSQLRSN